MAKLSRPMRLGICAVLAAACTAACASEPSRFPLPPQEPGPVQWNGDKIVSRVLPEPDFVSLFVRLPIAHAAATGRDVKVAVISSSKTEQLSAIIKRAAPACEVKRYPRLADQEAAPELANNVTADGCRVAVIPDITSWVGEVAITLVKALIHSRVVVLVPSDLSEDAAKIQIINKLHAIGAITVGRVNRQSTVMEQAESDTGNTPLNRHIRQIPTDLFSTVSVGPARSPLTPVATAAGVAALVLEKWPKLTPEKVREKMVTGARQVWQATSIETGQLNRWAATIDQITTEYKPTDEKAIFRFRVLDAPGSLGVDTEIPWFLNMLNCQKAWEITKGKGAVVVVSDSGFHLQHPDLVGRIDATAEFGPDSLKAPFQGFHGTGMSRIVLAVAPDARIIPVLCSAKDNSTRKEYVALLAENIAKSFQFAAEKKADVITSSWMYALNSDENLLASIRSTVARGVTASWFHYPRRDPGVLRPSFTYLRTWRDGEAIGFADRFLTDPPGFHPAEIEAGLSATAPQAAGIVALVRSVNPKLTPPEIETLFFENSTPIGQGILIPDAHEIVLAAKQKETKTSP